ARLFCIETADTGDMTRRLREVLFEQRGLVTASDEQHPARRQQRMLGESRGRVEKKVLGAPSERPDYRGPVGLDEERRRAPGRMVTGLTFAFEQQHSRIRRQFICGRRARDTGAHDYEIVVVHCTLLLSALLIAPAGGRDQAVAERRRSGYRFMWR